MLFGRFYVLLFLVVLVDFGFGFWSAVLCVFCKLLICFAFESEWSFLFPSLFLFWIMALRMISPSCFLTIACFVLLYLRSDWGAPRAKKLCTVSVISDALSRQAYVVELGGQPLFAEF